MISFVFPFVYLGGNGMAGLDWAWLEFWTGFSRGVCIRVSFVDRVPWGVMGCMGWVVMDLSGALHMGEFGSAGTSAQVYRTALGQGGCLLANVDMVFQVWVMVVV